MAGGNECIDRLCTGCCQEYTQIANYLPLVLGGTLLIISLYLIFFDPFKQDGLDAFASLSGVDTVKWLMAVVSITMFTAGCLGRSFTRTRDRKSGKWYVGVLSLALVLQILIVWNCAETLKTVQKVEEVVPTTDMKKTLAIERTAKVVRNSFRLFNENQCAPNGAWHLVHEEQEDSQEVDGETSPAMARALAGVQECKPTRQNIGCQKLGDTLSEKLSNYCMAKPGHEDVFESTCSTCVGEYWDRWIDKEGEDMTELKNAFEGDSGAVYCRCISRLMDSIRRNSNIWKNVGLFFGIVQAAHLAAAVWLVIWGPPPAAQQARTVSPTQGAEMAVKNQKNGPQQFQVTVPPDCYPGKEIQFQTGPGSSVTVTVPPGRMPGDTFTVTV